MKINLEQLYLLQCEVLRPFAPTQEFALLNLVVDSVDETELEQFGADVVQAFPHMQRLYSGFINASQGINNIVPFAVPVNDSESAMQDVLADSETGLNLSPALIRILSQACSRVPVREPHVDELNFPVEHAEPVSVEQIAQSAMTAIRHGMAPIVVRATKEQRNNRVNWNLNCAKLFGALFVEQNPLTPQQRLEYRVTRRSTLEIARAQSVN